MTSRCSRPSATFLFDSAGFLASWLADLEADQEKDGTVPFVVPDILGHEGVAAAAWGDAATIVPWVVYERTGDEGLLRRQLPSMRAWVDRLAKLAGTDHVWAGGFQFGDWLDPTAPPDAPFEAQADPDVIATAYFARSAQIVSDAAAVVGDDDVAGEYGELAHAVRRAFAREYVTPSGRVLSDAPTAYALAIEWALLPTGEQREHAARRLADLVRTSAFRISTGFVGTPLMVDALMSVGATDVAYRLLLQTQCPSWLYPVTMGATTVWERWDSMLPDGRINPGEMTSFNHYALGAVADLLQRRVAGLAPAAAGYREIGVRPLPTGELDSAAARHLTPYGAASVRWHRQDGQLRVAVRVPVGARARIELPSSEAVRVGHGDHEWTVPDPCSAEEDRTLPATIRDVLDDERLWKAVLAACEQSGISRTDTETAGRLDAYLDERVERLALALTAEGFAGDADALDRRLRELWPARGAGSSTTAAG